VSWGCIIFEKNQSLSHRYNFGTCGNRISTMFCLPPSPPCILCTAARNLKCPSTWSASGHRSCVMSASQDTTQKNVGRPAAECAAPALWSDHRPEESQWSYNKTSPRFEGWLLFLYTHAEELWCLFIHWTSRSVSPKGLGDCLACRNTQCRQSLTASVIAPYKRGHSVETPN